MSGGGVPNPGTRAAGALGCICAVLDNNHGQWPPHPPDGWWITEGCPVHAPASPVAAGLAAPETDGQLPFEEAVP